MGQTWIKSEDNVADDPTRHKELRPREFVSQDIQDLVDGTGDVSSCSVGTLAQSHPALATRMQAPSHGVSHARVCLEVYGGCGRLTAALLKRGLPCRDPLEAFPKPKVYRAEHDMNDRSVVKKLLAEASLGLFSFIHFGIPCSWWSNLARINGSSRRIHCPDGRGALLPGETQSEQQASDMADILIRHHRRGGLFTIENPLFSLLFLSKHFKRLASAVPLCEAHVDQCSYGLKLPGASAHCFCQKRTKFVANFESICELTRACPGRGPNHHHEHAIGSRVVVSNLGKSQRVSLAKAAGRYPLSLCQGLAGIVDRELCRRDHV